MLDNRLKMCAEMVSGKGIACDVGTDHAYLAAHLVVSGKCNRVIASDVNMGPLEAAARTIEKYGISDKVNIVLSDGLKDVPLENVSDVVIAGMGGETIAEIIGNINIDKCDFENIRWILQPMTKAEYLRKMLYQYGLKIISEKIIEDHDKMYVVICAEYDDEFRYLTESESFIGFFEENDSLAQKYRSKEAKRLKKVGESLEKSGKYPDAVHYKALAYKLEKGSGTVDINEVYSYLDHIYPFALQEKWDNCGLLVENPTMECKKIMLALDITDDVINEADCKSAQLIISHHPIIFNPLRKLYNSSPVYRLAEKGIAAICMHTNLDIANSGTNGVILKMISDKFMLDSEPKPFEELGMGKALGYIIELKQKIGALDLGAVLKELFGCNYVRMSRMGEKNCLISRIAFCSGSGGSMLELAEEKKCDALITGDVKHDVWIESNNYGKTVVYDCGHFHTENIVLTELRRVLEEKFPQLDIEISECSVDPCVYI